MTEDNNNSLIPIGSTALVRVGNSIDITNKIIKEHEERPIFSNIRTTKAGNSKDPNDADAYNTLGNEKFRLNDYNGAIKDYTKAIEIAIEIDPKYKYPYYNRGVAKYELKDYNGAIEDYSKAIEIDHKWANAYYNRGIAKGEIGDKAGQQSDQIIYEKLVNANK